MVDGKPYKVVRYHQLLEKNMVIAMLSEHSISLEDINNMPLLDRDYAYTKLIERQEHIKEEMQKQRNNKK